VKHFEMANDDSLEEILSAAQRSLIHSMRSVISDVRKTTKAPGLTLDQIDYLLESFKNKKPEIIVQRGEM
jgi:hypothetical protein